MELTLRVNGTAHRVDVEPRHTLADVLRERCGLTGTHLGCEQGVCGSCTVLVDGVAVRGCLLFAVQCAGAEVTTVEGLADPAGPHPILDSLVEHRGLQCGFCTPGFAVLLAGELTAEHARDDALLRELVASNLCRCTGYLGILAAAQEVAGRQPPPDHPSAE